MEGMAREIGCKKDEWPVKYLGVPLGGSPIKTEIWEPIVFKMSKQLASWKIFFLSRRGRLTLISAMLNALPMYFHISV